MRVDLSSWNDYLDNHDHYLYVGIIFEKQHEGLKK